MIRQYQSLEGTGRIDRALFKIRPLPVALLLRLIDGEPRRIGDAAPAQALANRMLVASFARGYQGEYTVTSLGREAAARIRARVAGGAGLGKMRPMTKIEVEIARGLGVMA